MWVTDISRITAVINAFLYQWQAQGISIAWKSLVYCGKKWGLEMKQVEGHMLLGVLVGSWEDSFSQNNKRQICEAYVRRNMNLLLISFQLKKEKIRNLLFSVAQAHPELVTLYLWVPQHCWAQWGASWTTELGLWDKHFQFKALPSLLPCVIWVVAWNTSPPSHICARTGQQGGGVHCLADSGALPSCCRPSVHSRSLARDLVLHSKGTVENAWAGLCPCCTAWASNHQLQVWLSMAESCVGAGKGKGIAWANPPYSLLLYVCTCKCLSLLWEHHSARLATANHMCSLKNIKSFF